MKGRHDHTPSEPNSIDTNQRYDEKPQHSVLTGDEALLSQCFPAGMTTPPIPKLGSHPISQACLTLETENCIDTATIASEEPQEHKVNLILVPEAPQTGGKSLKRKASGEQAGRGSK